MPGKEGPGRDQLTERNSHNANSSRARREAAIAAAHAETVRIKNQALDDVLAHIMRTFPMSDQARERIAEVLRGWWCR